MEPVCVGIDIGTSGVRACAITAEETLSATGSAALDDHGKDRRDPRTWRAATGSALKSLLNGIDPEAVVALSVDGTSGTVLPIDRDGRALANARMYNDASDDAVTLARIRAAAPPFSAALGATSGLAKAIGFQSVPGLFRSVHQADWISGQFSGRFVSDENNALKTGYDPVKGCWPDWLSDAGLGDKLLPPVLAPGDPVGEITRAASMEFGLSARTLVVAGTTDGCASFLATGASEAGDGVTALGTTLTLKVLSAAPINAPRFGVYSHKVLGQWLAGGASNSGGNVLLQHFSIEDIERLSATIDGTTPAGVRYYPLVKPGERFPHADPGFPPVLEPHPGSDVEFLKGMLDGMARIEEEGYRRLEELGAPALKSMRTVGGGARNEAWRRLRENRLKVPFKPAASEEAAFGAARLALHGARQQGVI